jgi:regulatory protein RepA
MTEARENAFGPALNIGYLLSNPAPAPDFVLPGLVSGSVGMLSGPGGIGKTMLELQLSVSLAAGLSRHDGLLGHDWGANLPDTPQRVVLVAAEEPLDVIWRRIHAIVHSLNLRNTLPSDLSWDEFLVRLKANLHIHALGGAKRVSLIDEYMAPTAAVTDLLEITEGARLVIVDPLRQVHLQDENHSNAMSAVVSVFKQVARKTNAAVLFAHHHSRAASTHGFGDSADASRGSTALTDDARWQLNVTHPSKDLLNQFEVESGGVHDFVSLHNAKSNYEARSTPVLLRRTVSGVLIPVERKASLTTKPARSKP